MSWTAYDPSLAGAWDAFISVQPGGRMVHLTGYKKTIEETYRLTPFYRAFVSGGSIKAVFPGFFHNSRIYGRKILSQPFSEYGGLLMSQDASPDERKEILDGFLKMTERALRATAYVHLEMRQPLSLSAEETRRFQMLKLFKRVSRRIDAPDAMWRALDPKDRNIIQKGRNYGLSFLPAASESDLRSEFYPLYLATMKRLGTPPHPLAYFLRLSRCLPEAMKAFIVRVRRTPVAALVGWAVGKTIHVTDMCSDAAAFFLKPNDFIVWEFMAWAHRAGFEFFDFGPVRYRGQEIFKKKWKMNFEDYFYLYVSPRPDKIRTTFSGSGGIMAAVPEIWKAAMPPAFGRVLGKFLRREVGL